MPPSRPASKQQPSPTSIDAHQQFKFPTNAHLLITTPSRIFSWDASSVHTILTSSSNAIVAATEAKDGSGVLAVADKNVVVLHDTTRKQERSWGLGADGDEVRHLGYTFDAKSLFFSTNLTADIQRYSAEQSRLLGPTKAHVSPPVALAVSPTGHLMVSASDNPATVYLSNLTHKSTPILIEPRASEAVVTVVAFHPDRPSIFMLGFADGSLAAFDATKISRKETGSLSNQVSVNNCEIGHLTKLHRPVTEGKRTVCIADAVFLSGHKTRAISVGRDGKCRLVDFANGGVILRTWHAQAPVTSVSVFSRSTNQQARTATARTTSSRGVNTSADPDNLIAVGRIDGVIQIYNSLGLLMEQKVLRGDSQRVIRVEWVHGKSPCPISNSIVARGIETLPDIKFDLPQQPTTVLAAEPTGVRSPPTQSRNHSKLEHVGLPPTLRKPDSAKQPTTVATRQFTIHPDEIEDGTVRYTPHPAGTQLSHPTKGQYLDLFSPVKPVDVNHGKGDPNRITSPPRSRPQISKQTFVKVLDPTTTKGAETIVAEPRNLGLFPSTDSGSGANQESVLRQSRPPLPKHTLKISPLKHRPAIQPESQYRVRKRTSSHKKPHPPPSQNAKILADIRKLSATQKYHIPGGVLSSVSAPDSDLKHSDECKSKNKFHLLHRPKDHIDTDQNSKRALQIYEDIHEKQSWPHDSHQGSSLEDDIWLTSGSEEETTTRRSRNRPEVDRPPARQTPRSRVVSTGTISIMNHSKSIKHPHPLDGSTEDEMFNADETVIAADGTLAPSSKDIQALFPRSSSLSPHKSHTTGRHRRTKRSTAHPSGDRTLREIPVNTVVDRSGRKQGHVRSPWARAKAAKAVVGIDGDSVCSIRRSVKMLDGQTFEAGRVGGEAEGQGHCDVCAPTRDRVHSLEGEVARLKGEVLSLRAALRRSGVAVPSPLR